MEDIKCPECGQVMVKTSIGEDEFKTIVSIAERYIKATHQEVSYKIDVALALDMAHRNGCPIDLKGLMTASDFDLIHDVYGIKRNLNHKTGKLENCFLPRYALNQVKSDGNK